MPSPDLSNVMIHDDSLFSASHAPQEDFVLGNPFLAENKKNHIKKINTEAYLGVQ